MQKWWLSYYLLETYRAIFITDDENYSGKFYTGPPKTVSFPFPFHVPLLVYYTYNPTIIRIVRIIIERKHFKAIWLPFHVPFPLFTFLRFLRLNTRRFCTRSAWRRSRAPALPSCSLSRRVKAWWLLDGIILTWAPITSASKSNSQPTLQSCEATSTKSCTIIKEQSVRKECFFLFWN